MKTKKCFKCGKVKLLSEFYKHKQMKDGHLNKCKECNKKDVQENYKKNIDHYTKYEISRRSDPKRLKARRDHSRLIRKNEPERYKKYQKNYRSTKKKSVNILSNYLRNNKDFKKPCVVCGNPKSEGHHEDYEKPLEVVWLCHKHHMEIHRKHK